MKIALVQKKASGNNIMENLKLAIKIIKQAKNDGADIVLFPEMWSNGYSPPYKSAFENPLNSLFELQRNMWISNAVDNNSEYIKSIRVIAKKLSIGVVITFLKKCEGKPKNSATFIDRNGEIILEYDKVHTCDFSLEMLLESGTEFKICDFDSVKIGIMICYDREFPESARVLMLKGAEIILVPNACDMNPARLNQLSTRAFENMTALAMANYPKIGWGNSVAYSPIVFDENGYVSNEIFRADDITENTFIIEFDINKIRTYRENETWGNSYRKVKAYKELLDNEIKKPFIR